MDDTGIVYMNDPSYATAALFHGPSPSMQTYISTSVNDYVAAVGQAAPQFAAVVQDRYNAICNSGAMQYVKNLKNRISAIWQPNCIRSLNTINDIQQAPEAMQRWIMACPPIRKLYQDGGVSAYNGDYKNTHPYGIANTHYDYRRVTDGIVLQTEEGISYSNYYEADIASEDILSLLDKCSILRTWDVVQAHLNSTDNRDPTSQWNSTL